MARNTKPHPKTDGLPLKKRKFLAAYSVCGNVSRAAQVAEIDRDCHYIWRAKDPQYALDFKKAHATAADALEAEGRRRAEQGVCRMKFHNGKQILIPHPDGLMIPDPEGRMVKDSKGAKVPLMVPLMVPYMEHEYSDVLLIFLLKALRPKKFRDNVKTEHGGSIDLKLTGEDTPLPTPQEALKRLTELAKKLPK